ncbi:hypothetical protein BASA61_007034 [Batrachochytrium salamandrivorans]|nr:hypothetical protein BASA61_007034 [Batrachochytrium salamandrivorans]
MHQTTPSLESNTQLPLSKDRMFALLRPLCVACMDPVRCWQLTRTEGHPVAELLAALESIPNSDVYNHKDHHNDHHNDQDPLPSLLAYIGFPLVEALKARHTSSPTTIELVCKCLWLLLVRCISSIDRYCPPPAMIASILVELPLLLTVLPQRTTTTTGPTHSSTTGPTPIPTKGTRSSLINPLSSEYLKICVVMLLQTVLEGETALRTHSASTPSVDFTAVQIQPVLAHNITMLLDILATERSIELCKYAIDALSLLVGLIRSSPDRLAQFLPGIASGLVRLLLASDEKHHHSLLVGSLKVLEDIIVNCLNDAASLEFLEKQDSLTDLLESLKVSVHPQSSSSSIVQAVCLAKDDDATKPHSSMVFQRSLEWHKLTSSRMAVILPKLGRLRLHQHPSVQQRLLNLSTALLESCSQSLTGSISCLVDNVILLDTILSPDNTTHTDRTGRSTDLRRPHDTLRRFADQSLITMRVLSDRFAEILDTLPKDLASTNETDQLTALLLVNGYICFLQDRSASVIQEKQSQITQALMHILVFETDGVRAVESQHAVLGAALVLMEPSPNPTLLDRDMLIATPQRKFQTFRDPRILVQIYRLCRLLAYYGDASLLAEAYSNLLNADVDKQDDSMSTFHPKMPQKQHYRDHQVALFVLGQIFIGVFGRGLERDGIQPLDASSIQHLNAVNLSRSVISDFLGLAVLKMPTHISEKRLFIESDSSGNSVQLDHAISAKPVHQPHIRDFSHVILCVSLVLEGLGSLATSLTRDEATLILIDGLYPILEKLGDRNHAVSDAAAWALQQFAKTCSELHPSLEVVVPSSIPAYVSPLPFIQSAAHPDLNQEECANSSISRPSGTIAHLVLSHIDYLVDSVSRRIRHIRHFPMAPKVLTAAIRVVGSGIVGPLLTDCVDILIDTLDELGTSGRGGEVFSLVSNPGSSARVRSAQGVDPQRSALFLDTEDPGLVGEVISVLYALIEVMEKASKSKKDKSSVLCAPISGSQTGVKGHLGLDPSLEASVDDTVNSHSDSHAVDHLLGIPACSPEIRAYFIERRKLGSDSAAEVDDGLSASEFFKRDLKEKSNKANADPAGSLGDSNPISNDNQTGDEHDGLSDHGVNPSKPDGRSDPDPVPPTPFEALTLQILSKLLYFLSSDSPLVRVRVLRMFGMGLNLLCMRPGDLNPLINAMWPKLVHRTRDTHHYVVLEAVLVVEAVAIASPDFIRKRISTDIVPMYAELFKSLQSRVVKALTPPAVGRSQTAAAKPHFGHVGLPGSARGAVTPSAILLDDRAEAGLRESSLSSLTYLSQSLPTTSVENRLFVTCLNTLGSLMEKVKLLRHDLDLLAGSVIGLLNQRFYSANVRGLAIDLIRRMSCARMEDVGSRCDSTPDGRLDWIWALSWMASGATRLEYQQKSGVGSTHLAQLTADAGVSTGTGTGDVDLGTGLKSIQVTCGARSAFAPLGSYADYDMGSIAAVLALCGDTGVVFPGGADWTFVDLPCGGRWTRGF